MMRSDLLALASTYTGILLMKRIQASMSGRIVKLMVLPMLRAMCTLMKDEGYLQVCAHGVDAFRQNEPCVIK